MSRSNHDNNEDPSTLHQQNEAALHEIEAAIKQQPLTSDLLPISSLKEQYTNESANFRQGLKALEHDFSEIRAVRGDGNCFFRAFLYALVEKLRDNESEASRILHYFQDKSWKDVVAVGYDEMAIESFYDAVVDLCQRVVSSDPTALHDELNEENGTSDYCTWYLRVVTAMHLKLHPDRFLPFLVQQQTDSAFLDINQFCARFVEPMGQESEEVQVLALAEAVGIRVHIKYLDGRPLEQNKKLTSYEFGPEESATKLTLLYRPGHYDILYKAS